MRLVPRRLGGGCGRAAARAARPRGGQAAGGDPGRSCGHGDAAACSGSSGLRPVPRAGAGVLALLHVDDGRPGPSVAVDHLADVAPWRQRRAAHDRQLRRGPQPRRPAVPPIWSLLRDAGVSVGVRLAPHPPGPGRPRLLRVLPARRVRVRAGGAPAGAGRLPSSPASCGGPARGSARSSPTMSHPPCMIERVARQVEANPGSQLWIASSMGQRATMAEGLETQLYLTQPTRFFEAMGLPDEDAWQRRPAMLPQFDLVVADKLVEQFRSRSPCSRSRRPSCRPWASSRRPIWPSRPCSPSCCPPDAPAGAVSRVMAFLRRRHRAGFSAARSGAAWSSRCRSVTVVLPSSGPGTLSLFPVLARS